MKKYYYDLHIHSCLSPCGDDDMTPNNIAGMGTVVGLDIMALTDHNTCKNCPAFMKTARERGIIPIAGMELTTAEDIHLVCLFDTLEKAMSFSHRVNESRVLIKNRADIFGKQQIMNENDKVIGEEEHLLSNATLITVDEAPILVEEYGGVCYPAHIDRPSNSVTVTLGVFPENPFFNNAEIHSKEKIGELEKLYSNIKSKQYIFSSDAHYLHHISERENFFELSGNGEEETVKSLFEKLKGI